MNGFKKSLVIGGLGLFGALSVVPMAQAQNPLGVAADIAAGAFIFGGQIIAGIQMAGTGRAGIGAATAIAKVMAGAGAKVGMAGTTAAMVVLMAVLMAEVVRTVVLTLMALRTAATITTDPC